MDARQRYDEKLERILRTSARIFAEKGYDRASIRDISAATDVSLSGLYYYFKSKEELLFLIQSHCFETVVEHAREALASVSDPVDRLRTLVRSHLRFFVDNMPEMKVLSHEADALTGEYADRVREQKREYAEIVQDCLAALAPPRSAADLRVATFTLFGQMNWIYNWYRPDGDMDVDQLADQMLHIFLSGFRKPVKEGRSETDSTHDEVSIWRGPERERPGVSR